MLYKKLALVFLLFVVACTGCAVDLTNSPSPKPVKTDLATSSPYPSRLETTYPQPVAKIETALPYPSSVANSYPEPTTMRPGTASPYPSPVDYTPDGRFSPTATLTNPRPATDAMRRYAIEVLEPYFKALPYYDKALSSPPIYRTYYGCVNNGSVGGVISYYVTQDPDSILRQFDKYLTHYSIQSDGWKEIDVTSFLGKRIIALSSKDLPREDLSRLLTFDAAIYDYAGIKDLKGSVLPYRSSIFVEISFIEDTTNYIAEENKSSALYNSCPDGQLWLDMNPVVTP